MRITHDALTFDDVLLKPAYSEILPREVSLRTHVTRGITLNIPILSAAMDTVTEARLAIALAQEGGMGIIHKNMSPADQARQVAQVKKYESGIVNDPITVRPDQTIREVLAITHAHNISGVPVVDKGRTVGIVTNRDLRFETRLDAPVSTVMTPESRLVTVREGADKKEVLALLHKHRIEKVLVVSENFQLRGMITAKDFQKAKDYPYACKDDRGAGGRRRRRAATPSASGGGGRRPADRRHRPRRACSTGSAPSSWHRLRSSAATSSRRKRRVRWWLPVDAGPGSICTTRIIAGVGVPQITAVANVAAALEGTGVPLIADGGIRYSGDFAKAIAAGAHCTMIGGLFAGTEEAPGEVELYQGRSYKSYRGMGSLGAMAQRHGSSDRYFQDSSAELEKLVPEGIEGRVPYKGGLTTIVTQLVGGLRAAMGYTGCANIEELRSKAEFVRITGAGIRESHVHDVTMTKEPPNYRMES
jgi:IMP dehydrogenase